MTREGEGHHQNDPSGVTILVTTGDGHPYPVVPVGRLQIRHRQESWVRSGSW